MITLSHAISQRLLTERDVSEVRVTRECVACVLQEKLISFARHRAFCECEDHRAFPWPVLYMYTCINVCPASWEQCCYSICERYSRACTSTLSSQKLFAQVSDRPGGKFRSENWICTQLAFYVNLHRAVIGPSATLTGRWRPDIDLRRMLTG